MFLTCKIKLEQRVFHIQKFTGVDAFTPVIGVRCRSVHGNGAFGELVLWI